MAFDPVTGVYKPEDASVANKVQGLIAKDSPLMQQAATTGLKSANRRGLLNSSMGVQAAQAATLDAALPIASQDASQAHQTNLQGRELQSQFKMQGASIDSSERMQQADIAFRENVSNLDREAQERIATMNVAAGERQHASQMAVQFEQSYAQIIATIMNNPDIPADVRQQYLNHAATVRNSNFAMIEQMYGIELDWSTTPTPPASGGGDDAEGGNDAGGNGTGLSQALESFQNSQGGYSNEPVP